MLPGSKSMLSACLRSHSVIRSLVRLGVRAACQHLLLSAWALHLPYCMR